MSHPGSPSHPKPYVTRRPVPPPPPKKKKYLRPGDVLNNESLDSHIKQAIEDEYPILKNAELFDAMLDAFMDLPADHEFKKEVITRVAMKRINHENKSN